MKKLTFSTDKIYEKASISISHSIAQKLKEKERVILGIAGGKSISNTLNELIKLPISWERVHVFLVDERLVPIEHDESNFKMIKEKFSDIIPRKNLHPYIFDETKNQCGLQDYISDMKNFGGECDIVIVSCGEDGHIGSLFPDHPSINDDSSEFIRVRNSPKPPPDRISMSRNMILSSKIGYLFITGKNKKDAYEKFFDSSVTYVKCPSKLVLDLPESYVFTDIEKVGE